MFAFVLIGYLFVMILDFMRIKRSRWIRHSKCGVEIAAVHIYCVTGNERFFVKFLVALKWHCATIAIEI